MSYTEILQKYIESRNLLKSLEIGSDEYKSEEDKCFDYHKQMMEMCEAIGSYRCNKFP